MIEWQGWKWLLSPDGCEVYYVSPGKLVQYIHLPLKCDLLRLPQYSGNKNFLILEWRGNIRYHLALVDDAPCLTEVQRQLPLIQAGGQALNGHPSTIPQPLNLGTLNKPSVPDYKNHPISVGQTSYMAASYKCLSCGQALEARDMEVNPKTGNIWGCFKCGGKKIQGAAPMLDSLVNAENQPQAGSTSEWDNFQDLFKKKPLP